MFSIMFSCRFHLPVKFPICNAAGAQARCCVFDVDRLAESPTDSNRHGGAALKLADVLECS